MTGQATVTIGEVTWACSVASSPGERLAGLSGVASIPPGSGMLFDMGGDQNIINVTTSEMLFNLDIVFMDSGGQVLGVARGVEPGQNVTFDAAGGPEARYFMEVNAGEAVGVGAGDTAVIDIVQEGVDLFTILGLAVMVGMMGAVMREMSGGKHEQDIL